MDTHHTASYSFKQSKPSATDSPAAFFDVDGTLLPGTFGEGIFIRYLMDHKVLTWKHLARYLISVLSGGDFFRRVAWERNKIYLKGLRAVAVRRWAQRCFSNRILPRLSKRGLAAVKDHLQEGHRVFLVSASLSDLVEPLRKHLDAHGVLATRLASKGGYLIGKSEGDFVYGQRKVELLHQCASQWNIDLEHSFAYSDHSSDIPLLEMVGHPVAVNPDEELLRHAVKHGWPVEMF
jgi:HAD superfamily hydrolase (TIGR01490 family)